MTSHQKQYSPISPNDTLIENLRHFMTTEKIHEAELCRQTSIPQPTLHKILTGKTADPRMSTLQMLAHYFGVTLDALYENHALKNHYGALTGKPIPIISWSECIQFRGFIKNLSASNWEHWVIVDSHHNESLFALKSKASMEPRFPRGTVFIVDAKIAPKDGDLVIVHYPDTKECALRELSIDGRDELLLSLNGHGKSERLMKSIRIVGVVVQSRFTYQSEEDKTSSLR